MKSSYGKQFQKNEVTEDELIKQYFAKNFPVETVKPYYSVFDAKSRPNTAIYFISIFEYHPMQRHLKPLL